MNESADLWPYWSIDIPQLTETQAAEVLKLLPQAGVTGGGYAVDPRYFVTLHLDEITARAVCLAISEALSEAKIIGEERVILASLNESLGELISALDPETDE